MILEKILENVEEEVEELLITINCQDQNSCTLIFIITRTHTDGLTTLPLFVFTLDFLKHFLQIF